MPETMWEKTRTNGKVGFDKVWAALDKLGAPVNRLSNKLGSEAFWPTTLDKESDKAARILKSFCKDGFYAKEQVKETAGQPSDSGIPQGKQRVLKKIPTKVIQNAKGLAIFTTMRTGLWVSGAGGSGVLIARLPDGSWSPPSGILLHTAALGFLIGVDIYDCVVVINSEEALQAFTKIRCTIGGEISAVAGPVGVGGMLESEIHKRQAPIYTYLKSRGFYAGVQVDGTVVIERTDENERFYSQRIGVADILAGKARYPPREIKMLMDTVRAAEGYAVDDELLPHEAPPGDYEIEESSDGSHVFGIPAVEDPDPFGVLALQEQGLEIREAGTKEVPSIEEFEFHPNPTSPVQNVYRRSADSKSILAGMSGSRRSSAEVKRNTWRASTISNASRMTDTATQTDTGELDQRSPLSPSFPSSVGRSRASSLQYRPGIDDGPKHAPVARLGPPPALPPRNKSSGDSASALQEVTPEPLASPDVVPADSATKDLGEVDTDVDADEEEDAVIQTAVTPLAPSAPAQTLSKPRLVTVHKVAPPKLPTRNPDRDQKRLGGEDGASISPVSATSKSSFDVVSEKPVATGELSSEAGSGRTAGSLSSFETMEVKKAEIQKEKEDDGFEDVQLGTAETETRQDSEARSPVAAAKNSSDNKRDSGAMRLFAERMKLDDDDEDDEPVRHTPGGW